jgi:hypothetical protein
MFVTADTILTTVSHPAWVSPSNSAAMKRATRS